MFLNRMTDSHWNPRDKAITAVTVLIMAHPFIIYGLFVLLQKVYFTSQMLMSKVHVPLVDPSRCPNRTSEIKICSEIALKVFPEMALEKYLYVS